MTSTINNNELWDVICDDALLKRDYFVCGVYQNRYIVVAGGVKVDRRFHHKMTPSVAMYDTSNHSYIALPNLLQKGNYRRVVVNGYFYVVDRFSSKRYRLCLSDSKKWEPLSNLICMYLLTDGFNIYLIDDNGTIISFGSTFSNPCRLELRKFPPVLVDNKIYFIGNGFENHYFDLFTRSWYKVSPLPTQLVKFDAVAIADRWIMIMGCISNVDRNQDHSRNNLHIVYDTKTKEWTQDNITLSSPRSSHHCVKVGC